MNATAPYNDNTYYKHVQPPQAYVPYSAPNAKSYAPAQAPADEAMLPIAIIGLCVTVMFGLPVGIVTGPIALRRAQQVDTHIRDGRRPMGDRGNVTGTRICAWLGIGWSALLLLVWLGMIALIGVALAA